MSTTAITNLMRLDEKLYLGHTPYMVDYWYEHKHNIKQMIERLLSCERLVAFLEVCGKSSLQYNRLTGAVPAAYNDDVLAPAYRRVEELTRGGDKLLIYEFMDGFYGAVDMIKQRKDASMAMAFDEEQGWFRVAESLEKITGKSEDELEADAGQYRELFLPQMMIYFLRFLHFYDAALEGQDVADFEERGVNQERKQREQCSARAVQELWARLAAGDFSIDASASSSSSASISSGSVKIPKPFEEKFLKKAIGEAVDALELAWGEHERAFVQQWPALSAAARENHCAEARELVTKARSGALLPSVMYCPELHPPTLAAGAGEAFVQLLHMALRMEDDDYADDEQFLRLLRQYLQSLKQEEMLPTITLMRRTAIALFAQLVVRLALQLPLPQDASPAASSSSSSPSSSEPVVNSPLPPPTMPTPPVMRPPPRGHPAKPPPSPASNREDLHVQIDTAPKPAPAGACARCAKPASDSCARCKARGQPTLYCSTTCQRADWPTHKLVCTSSASN